MRDRRVAEPLQARQRHDRQQRSDVQARRGRIEADVAGHPLLRQHRPARPRSRHRPCRATGTLQTCHHDTLSTDPMALDSQPSTILRPCGRDAPRLSPVGHRHRRSAPSPASAAYGAAYERHHIARIVRDLAGARPAARARRPAHRHDHRRASQLGGAGRRCRPGGGAAQGSRPRHRRARRRLRFVLRSRLCRPGRRAAGAARQCAAGIVRGARQSRRREGNAGGAGGARLHGAEGSARPR